MVFTLWQAIKACATNPEQRTCQSMIVINRPNMTHNGLLPWIINAQEICGPNNTAKDISLPKLANSVLFLMYFRPQGVKENKDLPWCLITFTGEWMVLENMLAQAGSRGAEVLGASLPCGRRSWGKLPGCAQEEGCAKRGSCTAPFAWEKPLESEPGPAEKNTELTKHGANQAVYESKLPFKRKMAHFNPL